MEAPKETSTKPKLRIPQKLTLAGLPIYRTRKSFNGKARSTNFQKYLKKLFCTIGLFGMQTEVSANDINLNFQMMPAEIKIYILDLLPNKTNNIQQEKEEIKLCIDSINNLLITNKRNCEELRSLSKLIFKNFICSFKITTLLQISQLPRFLKDNLLLDLKNNRELKKRICIIKKEIAKKCDHDEASSIFKDNAQLSDNDVKTLVNLIDLNIIYEYDLDHLLFISTKLSCEKFAKFLLSRGANVNYKNNEMRTPLMVAILTGNEELARFFIDNDANIDATDLRGDSVLMIAIRCRKINIAKELISLGAKINFKNRTNHTALTIAKVQGLTEIEALLQIKNFNI